MAHYYFDLRDGDELVADEEGMELSNMETVQEEATRALAGLATDSVRNFNGARGHQMAIEVRDQVGPVMEVKFTFEIARKH
jgi:hypothetical protein